MFEAKNVMGLIFSNMHDDTIREMTEKRTMGSVPFCGRYRLIDFVLSSMVNSGIQSVGVITKSNYQSLMDHLGSGRAWDLARKRNGLYILPPFGSAASGGIYRGRMEALAGVMGYIKHSDAQYVVMADCDIICNIDMRDLVSYHIEKQADITVAYQKKFVNGQTSKDVTVISNDDDGRVRDVMIAPATVGECNVSINIVVMSKNFLERIVDECMSRNLYSFDKDVLQARVSNLKIYGYEYGGYCARIDSIQDYYNANMEMLDTETRNSLFIPSKPIYTKVRDEVPAKYGLEAKVSNSLIADGCEIYGEVENSIIFRGVKIGKGTRISNSIIMQGTDIGANCQLNYCVTDKDVTVKNGRMLMGYLSYPVFISKGSVV